jgi:hypothetical protein
MSRHCQGLRNTTLEEINFNYVIFHFRLLAEVGVVLDWKKHLVLKVAEMYFLTNILSSSKLKSQIEFEH